MLEQCFQLLIKKVYVNHNSQPKLSILKILFSKMKLDHIKINTIIYNKISLSKHISMISLQELYPEGSYLDFKDKDTNQWQVGLVLKTNENSVRVRTQGWPSKYDQLIFDYNNRIKPFRTMVRGYTGQQKNPAVREHWKFSLEDHKFRLELITKCNNDKKLQQLKWIQFIRGEHYFYIDFLLSQTYKTQEQLEGMYDYLKQHVIFANSYLTQFQHNLKLWFQEDQKQRGYREAYYEIFDGVYLLTANSLRHSSFKKNNSNLAALLYPNATYQIIVAKIIKEQGLDLRFAKTMGYLAAEKELNLPVSFIYSLLRLFVAVQRSLIQREDAEQQGAEFNKAKRKKLLLTLFELIRRKIDNLKPFQLKSSQNQRQLQIILSQAVPLFFKYGLQKSIFQWIAKSRLRNDVLLLSTDSLQKKLKGINKIKQHLQSAIIKNQYAICKLTIQSYVQVFRQGKVRQVIFVENEHPELIKKGVDLWLALYKEKAASFEDLVHIWKSCVAKHQAIRKVIFQFWIDLIPLVNEDLDQLIQTLLTITNRADCLNQQWQISMLTNFIGKVIQQQTESPNSSLKPQIYSQIMQLGYNKLLLIQDGLQIDKILLEFAKTVTQGDFSNNLIKECFVQISRGLNTKFNTLFLTNVYAQTKNKNTFVAGNSLTIILGQLEKSPEFSSMIFQLVNEICSFCRRQMQLQIFREEQFQILWKLSQENKDIKKEFFRWIITEYGSIFSQNAVYQINPLLEEHLKVNVFKNYLCNFGKMDYINLSLEQFTIFKEFFLQVNRLQNKIENTRLPALIRIIKVAQTDMVGLKFVWDIFLNCKNEEVLAALNKLIIVLYLNSHSKLTRQVRKTRVMSLMAKIEKNLKDGYRKGNTRIIVSTVRLLKLLIDVLKYRNVAYSQKVAKLSNKHTLKIKAETGTIEVQTNWSSSYNQIFKKIAEKLKVQATEIIILNFKGEEISYQLGTVPFCFCFEKETMQVKICQNQKSIFQQVAAFIKSKLQSIFIEIIQDSEVSQQAYSLLEEFQFQEKVQELIQKIQNTIKSQIKKQQSMEQNQIFLRLLQSKIVLSKIQKGFENKSLLHSIISKNLQILGSELHLPLMAKLIMSSSKIIFQYFKLLDKNKKLEEAKSDFSQAQTVQKSLKQIQLLCDSIKKDENLTQEGKLEKIKIFFNCFGLVELLKPKDTISHLLNCKVFGQIMYNIYINKCIAQIRLICTEKLKKLIKVIGQQQNSYQNISQNLSILFFQNLYPKASQQDVKHAFNKSNFYFYNLLSFIIQKLKENHFYSYIVESGLYSVIRAKLRENTDHIKEYQCNHVLRGNLDVLAAIYHRKPELFSSQQASFLLQDCLELVHNSPPFALPRCYHQQSVKSCLEVIVAGSKNNAEKLIQITNHLKQYHLQDHWRNDYSWDVRVEKQVKQKFRGLENPGCICYMNSFLQQLFMNLNFRKELLKVATFQTQKSEAQSQLIRQLKKLFLQLIYSQEQALDSVPFSKTIRGYDNKPMIKVFVQMDIDQFSNIFFDRFEQSLNKLNHVNFVKSMFGGAYSHQIISTQCVHTSQREQQFMTVSLQVKNSLLQSLQALVRPEILDGENKYYCQRCDKKVKAQKVQTIKTSPQYLIIALKRFEYNFQIDAKIKVNDYCEFSQELDLSKYSQHYILNQKTKKEETLLKQQLSEFRYKLSGVVVHSGSAQNGHYYSLIKDEEGSWVEFNDSKVDGFDAKELAEVAFGSKNNEQKIKNAYLLFYQKISTAQSKQSAIKHISFLEQSQEAKEENDQIIMSIDKQNKVIHKYKLFFSVEYRQFIQKLWQNFDEIQANDQQKDRFSQFLLNYFITICIRQENSKHVEKFANKISTLLSDSTFARKMLLQVFKSTQMLSQIFVYCYNRRKCKIIEYLIRKAFTIQLQNNQPLQNLKEFINSVVALTVMHGNINELNKFLRKLLSLCKEKDRKDVLSIIVQSNLSHYILNNFLGAPFTKLEKQKVTSMSEGRPNAYKILGRVNKEGRKSNGSEVYESWRFISQISQYFKAIQAKQQLQALKLLLDKYLKEGTFNRVIFEAASSKAIYFLYQSLKNIQVVQNTLPSIQKGLRDYQSLKYRPFMLILQYIVCEQKGNEFLIEKIVSLFETVVDVNDKYFLQVNLILQWIQRIAAFSHVFEKSLIKNEAFLLKIEDWIEKHKMPTTDLVKKHKNIHNQRIINRINGILVSADPKLYQGCSQRLQKRFNSMIEAEPLQRLSPAWNKQFKEELKPEEKVKYYFTLQNKWKAGIVLSLNLGSINIKIQDNNEPTMINEQDEYLRPEWACAQQEEITQAYKFKDTVELPPTTPKTVNNQEEDLYS